MKGQSEYEERRGRIQAALWFMRVPSETVGTAYAKSFPVPYARMSTYVNVCPTTIPKRLDISCFKSVSVHGCAYANLRPSMHIVHSVASSEPFESFRDVCKTITRNLLYEPHVLSTFKRSTFN